MLPTIIVITLFIYFLSKKYRSYIDRKYQLKLYRLRDQLRDAACDGVVKRDDWTFQFMDSSITKMTKNLKSVNIFYAMYLRKKHAGDKEIRDFNRQLKFKLDRNAEIKKIHNDYQEILFSYLLSKHLFLLSFVTMAIYGYIRSVTKIKSWQFKASASIENLTIDPDTSASFDFIQKHRGNFNYAYC